MESSVRVLVHCNINFSPISLGPLNRAVVVRPRVRRGASTSVSRLVAIQNSRRDLSKKLMLQCTSRSSESALFVFGYRIHGGIFTF